MMGTMLLRIMVMELLQFERWMRWNMDDTMTINDNDMIMMIKMIMISL